MFQKIYKRPNFLESILINDYRVLFGEELMLKVQKIYFTEKYHLFNRKLTYLLQARYFCDFSLNYLFDGIQIISAMTPFF